MVAPLPQRPASFPLFQQHLFEHLQVVQEIQTLLEEPFNQWVQVCLTALQTGSHLFFFGNGGSAADAQHLAAEFVVRFEQNRIALPAVALTADTSILTAAGNDLGFETIFARQIEALGRAGDVAVALTTSGKSQNVIKGLQKAQEKGLTCVGLTGTAGKAHLTSYTDLLLSVPSAVTARIQEAHILLGHMLCAAMDEAWSGKDQIK